MAFPTNCAPRIINVDPTTGCSLTRASIRGMTPQDFEDQGFKEVYMDRLIQRAREARAAGVRESTLESLLFSRMQGIKGELTKQTVGASESVILPFIYRRQKRNIQSNYWNITGAEAASGAGSNGIPASAVSLTVTNSVSRYASALTELEKYFLPGKYMIVETLNADTKVAYSLMYKILSAATADGITKVTCVPNYSASGWAALSASDKAKYLPQVGLAFLLANSVSDYEQWCNQDVAENTNKLLTYWVQTSRFTHKYTDEYLKALNAALTSGYFKDFRQLPLAEQKRIQYQKYMRDWINAVFNGHRIDENQSVETYTSLPQVTDPNNDNCALEYKANALGFKTQLRDCGRVFDHQGNALNLDLLAQASYDMKRAREASGAGSVERIDWGCDRWTAGAILQLMTSFYKAKYGTEIHRYYEPNQSLTFENQVVLKYNVYQLPPDLGGIELGVYTDTYFDDKILATPDATKSSSRTLWGIDWSDFVLGICGSNSAARQTNIYDNLYNCVITPNITHYQLNSTQWTVIVEDPSRHYIIDNFSNEAPTLSSPTVNVAQG